MLGSFSVTGKWFTKSDLEKMKTAEVMYNFHKKLGDIMIYKQDGKRYTKQKVLRLYK